MNVPTPQLNRTSRGVISGRWRWWYASICDYRIAHPGCTNEEIALHLKKHPNTVSAITNTDLYREYEAQRLQAYRDRADTDLRIRMTSVATKALDSLEIQLDKKRDQVPLEVAREIAESTLDRLGFAPQRGPSVVVQNNQQVVLPNAVSPAALEEARSALRAVEQRRLLEGPSEVEVRLIPDSGESEALGVVNDPSRADS